MIGATFTFLGSLGMFLFGMKIMSEALQKLSGEQLRNAMRTMTSNRLAAVGTGFGVTCLVQSSSATTVMLVSFVNAGLLTLTEAIGMIMGANIGTTTTFWLVSFFGFKVSVSAFALPIMGIALPLLFMKRSKVRDTGEFFMGLGLLFLGLMFLKDSVPDIQKNPEALEFITRFTGKGFLSVLFFFAFGTLLTIVVQSSSVAGAITLTMAHKGWIDYPTACAIILGENVGTTITANLAAIGGSIEAKRAARSHFIFNVIGVIWVLPLFGLLTGLVDRMLPLNASDPVNIPIHMALFHTLFNVANTALLIGFVPQIAHLVTRLVKDRHLSPKDHVGFESAFFPKTSELNLAEAERDIQGMGTLARGLMQGFSDIVFSPAGDYSAKVEELQVLEQKSDQVAYETTHFLLECASGGLSSDTMDRITALLRVISELEDMCDCGYRLVRLSSRMHRKQRSLSPESMQQIRYFSELILQFMDFCQTRLISAAPLSDMETAFQLENNIDRLRKSLRKDSMQRMQMSSDTVKTELLYIDLLNLMERIGNHSLNILQAFRNK
jgi:phosphate:Na+ symporter